MEFSGQSFWNLSFSFLDGEGNCCLWNGDGEVSELWSMKEEWKDERREDLKKERTERKAREEKRSREGRRGGKWWGKSIYTSSDLKESKSLKVSFYIFLIDKLRLIFNEQISRFQVEWIGLLNLKVLPPSLCKNIVPHLVMFYLTMLLIDSKLTVRDSYHKFTIK